MRRVLTAILIVLSMALCACSSIVPSEYTVIAEHREAGSAQPQTDALRAQNFSELKRAIRSLIQNRQTDGTIRVSGYSDGNLEEDIAKAAYEAAREDPLGAYSVDFISHDGVQIVSYYEVHLSITYRDAAVDDSEIGYANTMMDVQLLIHKAMDNYQQRVTWYAIADANYDYDAIIDAYYSENRDRLMAKPDVRASRYPESGAPKIVELTLTYPASGQQLKDMEQAVTDSLHAASVYVRYRAQEREKAELLYTYLSERFTYRERQTGTPIYSALCEGLATSESMAASWQMLCREAGLDCRTVNGIHKGESYQWNILCLDGVYYHVDILRNLLENDTLRLYYDSDLTDYYWDLEDYPPCVMPEEELPEHPEAAEQTPPPEEIPPEQPDEDTLPIDSEKNKTDT